MARLGILVLKDSNFPSSCRPRPHQTWDSGLGGRIIPGNCSDIVLLPVANLHLVIIHPYFNHRAADIQCFTKKTEMMKCTFYGILSSILWPISSFSWFVCL